MTHDSSPQPKAPYVVHFASQKLIGYQCDNTGNFILKVFKAEVNMSDGSKWIIYGTKSVQGTDDVNWVASPNQPQPIIHRDNLGIWVIDPKTILK